MNSTSLKWKRFLVGFVLIVIILAVSFAWLPDWIHTYGATENEIQAVYPGDDILDTPIISWTHALNIAASPQEVWPWIAQIGDTKGGFYSYTFIENLVSGNDVYHNASRIIPEFQNPQPGEEIIGTVLPIKEVKTGDYFLAASNDFMGLGWTWVWVLQPSGNDQTRLLIRMKIQSPAEDSNPIFTWLMDAGGFVMEKGMLRGLQERAEGRFMPSPIEPLEGFLWGALLMIGFVGAWRFINWPGWQLPLATGLLSVVGLLVFTFIQPLNIIRIVFVFGMFGVVWFNMNSDEKQGKKINKSQ
jgi:hypothetical protein